MHVSANIIRFPEAPVAPSSRPASHEPPAEIVRFAPVAEASLVDAPAQTHGQFHAAHRIVTRVADHLDAIPAL
jgi:hypothetical protein